MEITNHEATEQFVLSDVADMLQGAGDDRIKSRILNHVTWLAPSRDESTQVSERIDWNKLIRATGGKFGKGDAMVKLVDDKTGGDIILWDVDLGEGHKIFFRRSEMESGSLVTEAFWAWLADDLEDEYPVYDEDLDASSEDEQVVKYMRSRMYAERSHVPVYDDNGFLLLNRDGEAEFGTESAADLELDFIPGQFVRVYKNWTPLARAEFGRGAAAAEMAAEYHAKLWQHLRKRNPRVEAAKAARRYIPGEQRPERPVQGRGTPQAKVAVVVHEPVVEPVEPKRSLFKRLLGR